MKKLFLVGFILCFAGSIFAQNKTSTVEEYKKRIQHNFNKYNSAINKKYSDYLRGIWERYNAYAPFTIPDEDITPVIYEGKDTITINEITIDQDDLLNIKQREHDIPSPLPIDIKKDEIEECEDNKTFSISFYNTAIEIHWNNFEFELNSCSNQSIGDAWDNFSKTSHLKHTIYDCLGIKEKYNLCDWAYLSLIHQISETIYNKTNNAVLLSAYFLEQSGYDIKLGRIHDKLYLLFSSEYEIYNHCYYIVDNVKYYPYYSSDDLNEMEICETPDKSKKSISLYIDKEQIFCKEQLKQRSITFGNSQRISISVNENLLSFYSSYPTSRINGNDMTRWAMYAQAPLNATTREELYKQLASLVAGKDELEAANILLNFVQSGFTYKYDEEVWGEDRAFFAEESLAYPYCDCEDRSILFSHIIRDLLELEVALVYSPGHLFTAVKFSDNVGGAYITINNEKYVVCEPTCTNGAPVGWSAIEEGCEDIELILLSKIKYGKSYKLSFNNRTNYQKSLFPICINGKYGYKNNENKIIIPCEYDSLGDSKQGDLFFMSLFDQIKCICLTLMAGVFVPNHCHENHPFFQNVLMNGDKRNWFYIKPDNSYTYFQKYKELPKFNIKNHDTANYLKKIAEELALCGVDGIRIDHAVGVPFEFLKELRSAVKKVNPNMMVFGEVLPVAPEYIDKIECKSVERRAQMLNNKTNQDGLQLDYNDTLDGVLDFVYRDIILSELHKGNNISTTNFELMSKLRTHFQKYSKEFMPIIFLDNHDVNRIMFHCNGNRWLMDKIVDFTRNLHIPYCIYYGTELYMCNKHPIDCGIDNVDLEVRTPMDWS